MSLPDPLIVPTQDEVALDPMLIRDRVVTFQIIGTLQGEESIVFEVEDPAAVGGWRTANIDGEELKIYLGHDQVTFYSPAYIRPHKSETTADCGLRVVTSGV